MCAKRLFELSGGLFEPSEESFKLSEVASMYDEPNLYRLVRFRELYYARVPKKIFEHFTKPLSSLRSLCCKKNILRLFRVTENHPLLVTANC